MTTKNTKNNITEEKLAGFSVRATQINKRKFYFLGDLVDAYGSRFVKHLSVPPVVARIAHNGNSQNRRLVPVLDFKTALKAEKALTKTKPKKVIAEQMEFAMCKSASVCECKAKSSRKTSGK